MNAGDVMTAQVIGVSPETPVGRVAELLVASGISAVPVLDAQGHLVGIVSEGDLVRRCEIGTDAGCRGILAILSAPDALKVQFIKTNAVKAADVMTRYVVTAAEETSLHDVVALFERHGIKRVPIMRDGKLVGIVSRANILRALFQDPPPAALCDDVALRDAVREKVSAMSAGSPWLISVDVRDGVIELRGTVGSNLDKRVVLVAVEAIPGAKGVADHLYVSPALNAA